MSPTECGVSQCDREALIMKGALAYLGSFRHGGKVYNILTDLMHITVYKYTQTRYSQDNTEAILFKYKS